MESTKLIPGDDPGDGQAAGKVIGEERLDEMFVKSFWRDILCEIISSMDPWDIDISVLATKYTSKLEEMQEMNFRVPANVVIVSAVLLRMKSQFMDPAQEQEGMDPIDMFESELDGEFDFMDLPEGSLADGSYADFAGLAPGEDPIVVKPKRVVKRRITAEELIAAIQEVLEDKGVKRRMQELRELEDDTETEIRITVERDIKHLIEDTYQRVVEILSKREHAIFSEMAREKDEVISTLVSLLHLSNNKKIKLKQEKLFEEIYISI